MGAEGCYGGAGDEGGLEGVCLGGEALGKVEGRGLCFRESDVVGGEVG